jgi:hypothetical protein
VESRTLRAKCDVIANRLAANGRQVEPTLADAIESYVEAWWRGKILRKQFDEARQAGDTPGMLQLDRSITRAERLAADLSKRLWPLESGAIFADGGVDDGADADEDDDR